MEKEDKAIRLLALNTVRMVEAIRKRCVETDAEAYTRWLEEREKRKNGTV